MKIFEAALNRRNTGRPPVWFMRQAGRYHAHYQALRARHSFEEICKTPGLACEAALGPVADFDFDAAILFSDILFPLEAMGMKLLYGERGPELSGSWETQPAPSADRLSFQAEAIALTRRGLSEDKGLLGFSGGLFTLFCYAEDGRHQGKLERSKKGLFDGRFNDFCERIAPMLSGSLAAQADAGADAIAILDTCAGELSPDEYGKYVVPRLKDLLVRYSRAGARSASVPVVYYSKGTGAAHWESLASLPIACLGIDWRHGLTGALIEMHQHWSLQGNIDPSWLLLPGRELEPKLRAVFDAAAKLPEEFRAGWVCGLGHGVPPRTPAENVRLFLRLVREVFGK